MDPSELALEAVEIISHLKEELYNRREWRFAFPTRICHAWTARAGCFQDGLKVFIFPRSQDCLYPRPRNESGRKRG